MGKYGSGISMKSMMEMEMTKIESVLNEYDMLDSDRKLITDAYKEICFNWCQTNAFACLAEEVTMQMLDPEHRLKMQKLMLQLSLSYATQKMVETYPWYDADPFEEDDDADD